MENRSGGQQRYLPGLDGIRALAVIAVVLFHSSLDVLPGGFLGVEVFFVISGFIITAGLVRERNREGRIALADFWRRRALRLLPAVGLLIVAVLAYAELFAADSLATLRNDAIAATLYVTNWHLIADGQSYFGGFQEPSLLRHLWSLAIEEQFYVVWPLVIFGGLLVMPRRLLAFFMLLGALGSALLMWALFEPAADTSRLYYGTDTRASGLLVGAALALAWTPRGAMPGRMSAAILAVAGLAALGILAWANYGLTDSSSRLYRGGFFAVDLATAVLIVAAVQPTLVSRALSAAPLRWIGLRSYGLYLWHWPIILVVNPGFGWPIGSLATFALQASLTVAIAAASYRYVEAPVRRMGFRGTWRRLRERVAVPLPVQVARAGATMAATCALVVVVGLAFTAREIDQPAYFELDSVRVVSPAPPPAPTADAEVSGVSYAAPKAREVSGAAISPLDSPDLAALGEAIRGEHAPGASPDAAAPTLDPAPAEPPASSPRPAIDLRVTAVGDSVMLGAANELALAVAGIDVDAMVSRSMDAAIGVLEARLQAGVLADTVLLHIGNNGPIRDDQVDRIADLVGDDRQVLILSLRVPRWWEADNNDVLARAVERHPNFDLLDWQALSAERPEILWKDGIHLRPEGASYYAALVQSALTSQ